VTDELGTQAPEAGEQKACRSTSPHVEEELLLWNDWIPSSDDMDVLKMLTQQSA
jgi:hypothetical protein